MAVYTTIPNSQVDADAAITQNMVRALRDNPIALFEHGTGAGYFAAAALETNGIDGAKLVDNTLDTARIAANGVDQAALLGGAGPTGAVGQGEISLSTAMHSAVTARYLPGSSLYGTAIAITSGNFLMGYQTWAVSGSYLFSIGYHPFNQGPMVAAGSITTGYTWAWMGVQNAGDSARMNTYRVATSPPYDLGHGEVAGFCYLDLALDGRIITAVLDDTPPWYTPEDFPRMRYGKNGKVYYQPRGQAPAGVLLDRDLREAYLAALAGPREEVELTPHAKNARMAEHPHPFGNPDGTVVMLDPQSDTLADLMTYAREAQAAGLDAAEADPLALIMGGDIVPGEEIVGYNAPPGVRVCRMAWR